MKLKLCLIILIIFTISLISYTNQGKSQDYLYKYNELYDSDKYMINNYHVERFYINFTCVSKSTTDNNCGNGECNEKGDDCVCYAGYTTYPGSYIKCSYQQKSKIKAFLLEMLGFGLGYLYIQNYSWFIAKFLFVYFSCYFVFCIMIFVGAINNSNVDEATYRSTKRTTFIIVPTMIVLYFFDLFRFILGYNKDSNGIDLY
jgi:hypothetical protein